MMLVKCSTFELRVVLNARQSSSSYPSFLVTLRISLSYPSLLCHATLSFAARGCVARLGGASKHYLASVGGFGAATR